MRSKEAVERISPKRSKDPVRELTADDVLGLGPTTSDWDIRLAIQQLVVEGLLSFGERTVFDFGRLNILVGPNGSGKSNLIDCVRVLRYAPSDIQETFKDSGFQDWLYKGPKEKSSTAFLEVTASLPETHKEIRHQLKLGPELKARARLEEVISSTHTEGEAEAYFIGSYRSGATITAVGTGKRRRERRMGDTEYDPFRSILSQIRDVGQYPEITLLADLYTRCRIYSEWSFGRSSRLREPTPAGRSDTILSDSMNDFALVLDGLKGTPTHEKIRERLKELKETYLDYVTRQIFGNVGLELQEAPFEFPVPAKRLSDGTLRFLALAAILLNSTPPPIICLEEPELGMHPDMIRMVARMIVECSERTQVLVSTHSEHLLTALQDDFDALFAFDAGLNGSIVTRFSQDEYKHWREEHTLGELWTSGELGGNRW
ncbi:MAG TPA: AAA family ATPase [Pyrinomonadaceae bacterium]|nr:AAA family ATPase [Pyrinomonadaceae bacterium]